jgi:phosphatidylethanolamine/phosphatidyl-N-methylethanolamine N-methyltransferase
MVEHLKSRAQRLQLQIDARVMDGQALDFGENTLNAVVLHLILAVIPDPYACIREATRVLKPSGRMVIFDKFLQDDQQPGIGRRLLNIFANTIFSDLNRQLRPLIATVPLKKVHEEETAYVRLGYRITLLGKEMRE